MANGSIKGITIEFRGDTTSLGKALTEVNRELKSTESALREVDKALKLDPDNVELLAQREALLNLEIQRTEEKLQLQKRAAQEAAQALEQGAITQEEYARLTAQLAQTENKLEGLKNEANGAAGALDDAGEEAEDAGNKAKKSGTDAEESGKNWEKFGDAAKKAAEMVAAAIGAALVATGKLVVDSVEAYAQMEQLEGGISRLYGTGGQSLQEYADSLGVIPAAAIDSYRQLEAANQAMLEQASNAWQTAGLDAQTYLQTATSFSASLIAGLGGDTQEAARLTDVAIQDMSDNANTFGTDMDTLIGVYQGLARGTYTSLEQLNLGFAGTQQGMLDLINSSGIFAEEVTSLDDVSFDQMIKAIHAVQEDIGIAGTTAREASGTVEGSVNTMKAAWRNLVAGLGGDSDEVSQLVGNLVVSFQTAAENILPVVQNVLINIGSTLEQLAPIINDYLPDLINQVIDLLLDASIQIVVSLVESLPSLLNTVTSALETLIVVLIPAILSILPDIISAGLDLVIALANAIAASAPELIPQVMECVNQIIATLVDHASEMAVAALELILGLAAGLIAALPELLNQVPTIVNELKDEFSDFIPDLVNMATTWGADLIANFVSGITNSIGNLTSTLSSIAGTIDSYIGFSVPEKGILHTWAYNNPGADMIDLFAEGMSDEKYALQKALVQTGDIIYNGMTPDYSGQLGMIAGSLDSLGVNKSGGTYIINVMVGNTRLAQAVISAQQMEAYRTGGL